MVSMVVDFMDSLYDALLIHDFVKIHPILLALFVIGIIFFLQFFTLSS